MSFVDQNICLMYFSCERMKTEASDICLNSAMMYWKNDDDDLLPDELANIESKFFFSLEM